MSIWDDIARAGAAVATGGLSEAVIDAAGGTRETAPPPTDDPPSAPVGSKGWIDLSGFSSLFNKHPAPGRACCPRYDLKPPFLLDNTTGDVWMFDESSKKFEKIEVERNPVAKVIERLVAAKVVTDLKSKLGENGVLVNREQYAELAPFVDRTMKALDLHLEEMKRI